MERAFDEDLTDVFGNQGELNQVWTNLIDNAADAIHDAGIGRAGGKTAA